MPADIPSKSFTHCLARRFSNGVCSVAFSTIKQQLAKSNTCVPLPLQAEGARGLAKGLAANATLSKLSLAWNGLEEGACALGDMLSANMGLKHLDLSHCR